MVDSTEASLLEISEADSGTPLHPGGWSRKQVIGHLIDSASNNHQRFVRAALQGSLEFPAYDQEGCVRVQAVQEMPWPVWSRCGPATTATWRTLWRIFPKMRSRRNAASVLANRSRSSSWPRII